MSKRKTPCDGHDTKDEPAAKAARTELPPMAVLFSKPIIIGFLDQIVVKMQAIQSERGADATCTLDDFKGVLPDDLVAHIRASPSSSTAAAGVELKLTAQTVIDTVAVIKGHSDSWFKILMDVVSTLFGGVVAATPELKAAGAGFVRVSKCDVCQKNILTGTRYHCSTCVDFDMCAACHSDHNNVTAHGHATFDAVQVQAVPAETLEAMGIATTLS